MSPPTLFKGQVNFILTSRGVGGNRLYGIICLGVSSEDYHYNGGSLVQH
jgi:hypothetical protein